MYWFPNKCQIVQLCMKIKQNITDLRVQRILAARLPLINKSDERHDNDSDGVGDAIKTASPSAHRSYFKSLKGGIEVCLDVGRIYVVEEEILLSVGREVFPLWHEHTASI